MGNWLKENWFRVVSPIVVIVLFSVFFFSSSETRFQCSGKISDSASNNVSTTLYLKIEKYSWWINLWSDSKGSVNVEIPNSRPWSEYHNFTEKAGDIILIYDTNPQKILRGTFSELSQALTLNMAIGDFIGLCNVYD